RNEARFGITQHIPGHRRPFAKLIDPPVPLQLPLEVETFAERLGVAGYATGYFGKWHLGGAGYGPAEQGWGTVIECQKHELPPALTGKVEAVRTAAFLTEKAVEFIETHREEPFVLQVSHYAVHIPLSTRPELLAKYQRKSPMPAYPSLPEYAGLLEEIDESVGGILAALDRLDLSRKTLVVFTSDNGGLVHDQGGKVFTSNLPLRGEKGTLYEGGIRVPAMMRWPGVIPEGVVCDVPAITSDLYPTFLELGGVAPSGKEVPDGLSLRALMRDPAYAMKRDALFWHLPHYHHSTPASAIRKNDWKLLEFLEDGHLELYHLASDPGETTNLAKQEAARSAELHAGLAQWRKDIGARMPEPNPAFDPLRAGEMAGGKRKQE
ncbi:MAG: sulfatase-like hydrolase/transferase, partial [Verrucomicrobiales bacterium]